MSSTSRPVVVLTAGGVGRPGVAPSKKKSSRSGTGKGEATTTPPEARESSDSFLDHEDPSAPFVDEPITSSSSEIATTIQEKAPSSSQQEQQSAITPVTKAFPHGRTTSVSSVPATTHSKSTEMLWLLICFLGIMASFVCYGLLLEYATSGGRKLHELSFLFVTSGLYTITAAAGRYVRDETPTTIPPARFAVLGLTSMGSTFFSVRSLR